MSSIPVHENVVVVKSQSAAGRSIAFDPAPLHPDRAPAWDQIPPLDLPTPLSRAAAGFSDGHHISHAARDFIFPAGLVRNLRRLSQVEGADESSAVISGIVAAFAMLLRRYSGKDLLAIAVLNQALGSCPAVRLRVPDGVAFAELVALARDAVQDAADPPASAAPITAAIVLGDISDEPLPLPILAAGYELLLWVRPSEAAWAASLIYKPVLFTAAAIERAASHLLHLLGQALDRPTTSTDTFALITSSERARIDGVFNATGRERGSSLCLHQLFERQAAVTPEHIAVESNATPLTYAQANHQANRIARGLRRLGVSSGSTVGVLLERGAEVIPVILGIMKSGAVYVPLDPAYPEDRLSTILEDCRPVCLLTDVVARRACPNYAGRMVEVAALLADISIKEHNVRVPVIPADLAYLIYTSGSTGRPKGVMIEHRSAAEMVAWALGEYPGRMLKNVLASTSLCFDLSIFEIFVPLSSGHTVFIAQNLLDWSEAGMPGSISLINTVPSALKELIAAGPIPASVVAINVAGEPLPEALVDAAWKASGNLKAMYNLYGPSEDTTYSTYAKVLPGRPVMIGSPVDNSATYVLDRFGHLLAVGVPGELWIGGDGLARGYWRQPDMTAERFVPDHISGQVGRRLYRTGDLGRWTENGELEFLGRIDHQVKIRGHRIELGEIETLLGRHIDVERAVLAAVDTPAGDKRLAAYVVIKPGHVCEIAGLSAYLKGRLPAYMCPAAILILSELPLTSNGKVDRKRLPVPRWSGNDTVFVAPSTAEEELLCRIWSKVLAVERVGLNDDFFALGGHSLLAMRVTSHIRSELGAHIPLRLIFEHPVLGSLAGEVARLRAPQISERLADAAVSSPGITQMVSSGEQRMFILSQLEPGSSKYNMAYAIHIEGRLDTDALERTLTRFSARHQVLASRFEVHGDLVRVPCLDGLPLRTISVTTDAELEGLVAVEPLAAFSFDSGLLWRMLLIQRGETRSVLVITLHHAIADDWSMAIWAREMGELYAAESSAREARLPPPPQPYSNFVHWQRTSEQQAIQASQSVYWADRLKDAPELLLPEVSSRSTSSGVPGAIFRFQIPARTAGRLKQLQITTGSSLFMVVLAAFKVLLHRYTGGQNDLLVATPASNRSRAEFEDVFGYFLNTIVLRSTISGDIAFRDYLLLVRDITLDAYANQDVPLERVLQLLSPNRDPGADVGRVPLVHAAVIVQHATEGLWPLGGLRAQCCELFTPSSKFDISLLVNEEAPSVNPSALQVDDSSREAGCWAAMFEYSTRFFDGPGIERLSHQMLNILEQVGENPDITIASIKPLRKTSELALLRRLSDAADLRSGSEIATLGSTSVHQRFEEQAALTPHSTAVVFGDESLTYSDLNLRADRLAQALYTLCGPHTRVAVLLERSIELIVAILAILKTGSAFVPIDPMAPPARQRLMIQDAEVAAIVTHSALPCLGRIAAEHDPLLTQLHIDLFEQQQSTPEPASDLDLRVHAELPFYLIYTSGSTGKPKSVCLPHRAILNLVDWYGRSLSRSVRILQFASICFDVASLEIFSALLSGGTVVLIDAASHRDAALLAPVIAKAEIQQLFLPVVMLEMLANETLRSGLELPVLREVITAGEQLHITPAIRRFFQINSASLHNHYGPSETHVITAFDMARGPDVSKWPDRPSIGLPIDGCKAFVVDLYGELAPIGVSGELYLGGAGVAHGYWNRPDLTAERFVPDTLSGGSGNRLYRTGDLARWSSEGQLDFLERIDDQVKIRGFRVEPGEIQAAILRHPGVKQALVTLPPSSKHTQDSSEARLIAYLVLAGGHMVDVVHCLRETLPELLPDYMVPSTFVQLSALPTDANGKVDRRQLPEPLLAESNVPFAAPRTATEATLAELWIRTLNLQRVGVHDNFFQMGGHSFSAMQLASRIHDAFELRMPLHVIFSQPTIAQSARAIDSKLVERRTRQKEPNSAGITAPVV